jgi:hypothetical protein
MTDKELEELIEKNKRNKAKAAGEDMAIPEQEDTEYATPESLKRRIAKLESDLAKYEQNGVAKLYYSLNRKANEMADLMNNISLRDLDLDDAKSKSFDRLKVIWTGASEIATSISDLGKSAGITGNEREDVEKKPFVDTIAQDRR